MNKLEKKLQYEFKNKEILSTALTHSSYANEKKAHGAVSNERLEFLGDSVLGMTVAEYLYKEYPNLQEGQMTKLRAELVCEHSLAEIAEQLELGSYMYLGRGEDSTGGRQRPSVIADATEAVIAAVYLDGGFEAARSLINRLILVPSRMKEATHGRDNKTALQEIVQRKSNQVISYHVVQEEGPDHMKNFVMEVRLNGTPAGTGNGRTKKEAEQAAARDALSRMGK